ncbi:MAG: hypothetical protein ABEJ72_07755, partial [Candidatus Aenigmatarchaeota archaeon]
MNELPGEAVHSSRKPCTAWLVAQYQRNDTPSQGFEPEARRKGASHIKCRRATKSPAQGFEPWICTSARCRLS